MPSFLIWLSRRQANREMKKFRWGEWLLRKDSEINRWSENNRENNTAFMNLTGNQQSRIKIFRVLRTTQFVSSWNIPYFYFNNVLMWRMCEIQAKFCFSVGELLQTVKSWSQAPSRHLFICLLEMLMLFIEELKLQSGIYWRRTQANWLNRFQIVKAFIGIRLCC